MIPLDESGMKFEFPDGNCYEIEKDPLVKDNKCSSTSNNKACECISVIDGYHCFIEAKQSLPRKANGDVSDLQLNGNPVPPTWEVYDNFRQFLRSIAKKFIDSFNIMRAIAEGRHGKKRLNDILLPDKRLNLDKLRFILIINFPPHINVVKQELVTFTEALKNEMRPFLRTWNIPDTSIKVVLPDDARSLLHIPIVA